MFAKIENIFHSKTIKQIDLKQFRIDFYRRFITSNQHYWATKNKTINRALQILFHSFDDFTLSYFAKSDRALNIIRAEGKLASVVTGQAKSDHIIVFEDLYRLLQSASHMQGISVLAHEVGHIVLEHQKYNINNLKAQFEADAFAHHLGFGRELQSVLIDHIDSPDSEVRLEHLVAL